MMESNSFVQLRFALVSSAALLLLVPRLGNAEALTEPMSIRAAISIKERALDTGDPGDWREALQSFLAVSRESATAEVTYEVGFAASQIGLIAIAVEFYERALVRGLQGPAAARARLYVGTHRSKLGLLEVDVSEDVKLVVNGYDRTPSLPGSRVYVEPGPVHLEFVPQTGPTVTRDVPITAGEVVQVDWVAETRKHPSAPEPHLASLAPVAARAPSPVTVVTPLRPQPDSLRGHPHRQIGIALIAGGAAASVLGLMAIPWTTSNIDNARQALAQSCDVPSSGPDGCLHANATRREEAQSHADSIATWTTARYVAWGTLGTGIAAVGTGALLLSLNSKVKLPNFSLDGDQVIASFAGQF